MSLPNVPLVLGTLVRRTTARTVPAATATVGNAPVAASSALTANYYQVRGVSSSSSNNNNNGGTSALPTPCKPWTALSGVQHSFIDRGISGSLVQLNSFGHRHFSSKFPPPPDIPDEPFTFEMPAERISDMTEEELTRTDDIPGWDLVTNPSRKFPPGALVGTVVSTKMAKTVNVSVDRYKLYRKLRKKIRYTRKFMAHDEGEVANDGDIVMIVPSQKFSRRKHFMLYEIVRSNGQL